MKQTVTMSLLLFLLVVSAECGRGTVRREKKPIPELSLDTERELVRYIREHRQTPEDYIVGKFTEYDIVFVGEFHRIKHDVELIHGLIPRLYAAGVRNIGIEFGAYEYQGLVDSLVTADEYDEDLARWIMFKHFVAWGYKEYIDIYRKAWEFNRTLGENEPPFRIVNLNYRPDWTYRQEKMTRDLWKKVWHKGSGDKHMVDVIFREFVDRGEKALIYSGMHHAFTHYQQPVYNFEKKKFIRFEKERMGNIVHDRIPGRVFCIFLHSPWGSAEGISANNYPIHGVIDRVMSHFKDTPVGSDVKGSPFGALHDNSAYYALGYDDFTLSTYCDGYIYQKPFSEYEGCTVDPLFITEDNIGEAVANLPNPAARKYMKDPATFIDAMKHDADMKRRFDNLE